MEPFQRKAVIFFKMTDGSGRINKFPLEIIGKNVSLIYVDNFMGVAHDGDMSIWNRDSIISMSVETVTWLRHKEK